MREGVVGFLPRTERECLSSPVYPQILENFYAAIIRINHIHKVFAIDKQSGGQLEFPEAGSRPAKVIKKLTLAVKHLYHIAQTLNDVHVSLGIDANPFGAEQLTRAITVASDGVFKLSGRTIQHLHSEVHGINDDQVLTLDPQLCGVVKFTRAVATTAEFLQNVAFHIQDVNLMPKRVGHVDAVRL